MSPRRLSVPPSQFSQRDVCKRGLFILKPTNLPTWSPCSVQGSCTICQLWDPSPHDDACSFYTGWDITVTKQEGPGSRRALVAVVPSPSSTQMQNEAANEISRLEFVRLPIVTATRNASNSPMSKSKCHRIIELPTGTDIHTRRPRPRRLSGAVIFRIGGRLCAEKARSSYACDLMEQARQNHAVSSHSRSHQFSVMLLN